MISLNLETQSVSRKPDMFLFVNGNNLDSKSAWIPIFTTTFKAPSSIRLFHQNIRPSLSHVINTCLTLQYPVYKLLHRYPILSFTRSSVLNFLPTLFGHVILL